MVEHRTQMTSLDYWIITNIFVPTPPTVYFPKQFFFYRIATSPIFCFINFNSVDLYLLWVWVTYCPSKEVMDIIVCVTVAI